MSLRSSLFQVAGTAPLRSRMLRAMKVASRLVMIWISCLLVTASAEEGAVKRADGLVPAALEAWYIEVSFAGGAPGERTDRFTYEIAVSSRGKAKFENLREAGKKRVLLFDGKLEAEELAAVYQAVARAINDFQLAAGDSRGGDGWDVTVTLTARKHSSIQRSIQIGIYDLDSLRHAGPDVCRIFEIVNKHVDAANKIRIDRQ